MALANYLIHLCDIERDTTPTENTHGNNVPGWASVATGVACRLVVRQQRVLDTKTGQDPTITRYQMFILPAIDVREGDRLVNVTYPDTTVLSEVFLIESLLPRWNGTARHHTILELTRNS